MNSKVTEIVCIFILWRTFYFIRFSAVKSWPFAQFPVVYISYLFKPTFYQFTEFSRIFSFWWIYPDWQCYFSLITKIGFDLLAHKITKNVYVAFLFFCTYSSLYILCDQISTICTVSSGFLFLTIQLTFFQRFGKNRKS